MQGLKIFSNLKKKSLAILWKSHAIHLDIDLSRHLQQTSFKGDMSIFSIINLNPMQIAQLNWIIVFEREREMIVN